MDKQQIVQLVQYELGLTNDLPELDYTNLVKRGIILAKDGKITVNILKYHGEEPDVDEFEDFVDKFRKKFKAHPQIKGNLGNKAKVKERLSWFMVETGLSYEDVERVVDHYISECASSNRYLMDPHHFIWKQESSRKKSLTDSRMWSVYEDMDDTSETKTTYEL